MARRGRPGAGLFRAERDAYRRRRAALGIRGEDDLFGGVVPHAFVASKAITHPLPPDAAAAPEGWSPRLAGELEGAVLAGFAAFSAADAMAAGLRLLERGPVRVKAVGGVAGHDQLVVRSAGELRARIEAEDPAQLSAVGLALEEDLAEVTTYSVGQVRVAGLVASYYGVQRHTTDNLGEETYGGSSLLVARGGFRALLALDLPDSVRTAIRQARRYDRAVGRCYLGLIASRRNYDVAQGIAADGRVRSGVLEQSWRIGGASGAEVAALRAFRADPSLASVTATTVEIFGSAAPPPADALPLFAGTDSAVGPLTRYVLVDKP
ncbi:MAG: DUF3182 family protein [Pseudomonadota bacterium]|nr:DUF3182 family protein [Pseudomonadota bacterium]